MHRHTVPQGVPPMSLSRYLSRAFPRLPGWLVRETLKKKDIRINGARSGADAQVRGGDELLLYIDDHYFKTSVKIIYEDEGLLVSEKPVGLPVDADQAHVGADTMLSRLQAYCGSVQLCHRLDTGTGGVLIAAKTEPSLQEMTEAFRRHDALIKKYRCIVVGRPERREAQLKDWLVKDAGASKVRIVNAPVRGALPVETHYRLLESKNGLSLMEITLITGRTHQIRAHLSSVSLPLLGDDKYGNRDANRRYGKSQPALWCTEIRYKDHVFKSPAAFKL